jgi:molybdopterin synthase catalytic subunit
VAELVRSPIDVGKLITEASRPDCGAVSLFIGNSRDHNEGRRVARLEYEAYEPMALAALETLEREAKKQFKIATCRIVHRLGAVPLAEASVAVVVAAPHRQPAFDACQWAMNELKRSAPIWKKEFFAEGEAEWVKGTPLERR